VEIARLGAMRPIRAGEGQVFFAEGEGDAAGFAGVEGHALVGFECSTM
jgi:hypothetical protein